MSINDNRLINIIDKFQKLTEKSTRELQINSQLNSKLNNSKTRLLENENKIDELITKSANLDIFLEHLTSLILRSEFLESQLNNFERSIDNNTIYSSSKDESFDGGSLIDPNKKLHLDWRTTQTTYENLCLEYKYLSDQIKLANGYFPTSSTSTATSSNITPSDTYTRTSATIPNHETHNHVLNRLQSNCSSNLHESVTSNVSLNESLFSISSKTTNTSSFSNVHETANNNHHQHYHQKPNKYNNYNNNNNNNTVLNHNYTFDTGSFDSLNDIHNFNDDRHFSKDSVKNTTDKLNVNKRRLMKKESFLQIPKHHIDTTVQRPSLLYTSSVSSTASILNRNFSHYDDDLQEDEDDGIEFKNLRNFHFNSTSSYSSIYSTKRKMKKSDRNRRRTICSTTASYDSNDKLPTIDEMDSNSSTSSSNKTLKNSLKSISPSPPRSSVSFHRRFASLPENISSFTYIHGKNNNKNHNEFSEIMDETTDSLDPEASFNNDTIIIHKLNNNMLNDILDNDLNNTFNIDKTFIKEENTDTSCIKFRSPFITDGNLEKNNKLVNSNILDNSNIANLRHFASHDTGLNKRSNWNIIYNSNLTKDSNNNNNNNNNVDIQKPILSMDQAHATLITSSPNTQKIKNTDYIIHNKKSFPDISPSMTNVTTSVQPAKSNINNKFQSLLPTIQDTSFNDLDLDSNSDSDSDSDSDYDDDANCATSVRSLETFGNEDAQPFFIDGDVNEHESEEFEQFNSNANENTHSDVIQDKSIDCLEGFDVNKEYIPKQRLLRSKSHESIFSTLKDKQVKAKTNSEKLKSQTFKWLPKPKTIVTTSLSLSNQSSNLGMDSKLYSSTASHSNITRNQNNITVGGMNALSSIVHSASKNHQTSSLSVPPTAISAKNANSRVSSRDMLHSFIEHDNNSNINNNGISWISNRLIPTLTSTANNQNQDQNQNQESVAKNDTDDNSNTNSNLSSRLGSFETSFLKYLYVEHAPEMGLDSTSSNPFTENQSPFHSVFSNYHSSEVAETISDSPPLREDQKAVKNSLQDSHKDGTQKNPHQPTSESTSKVISKKEIPASTTNALPISLNEEQELTLTPTLSSSSLISGQNLSISASSLSSTALSHLGSLVSHLIPDSTVAYADVGKILNPDPPSPRRVLKSRDPRKLETYRYIRNNNETSSFIPIDTTARHTRRDFRSKSIESRIELNKQYQRGLYNQRNPTRNSTNFGNGQNLGSFTGSHSTLYLTKNGNRVVQHGAASSMNNHVLSTRVSHNSLKEALDSSFF